MVNHFKDACESVDAMVFTGDTLWDSANRQEFADYLARWTKGLEETNRCVNEFKKQK